MYTVQWTIFTFLTLILKLYVLLELFPLKVDKMMIFHVKFKIVYIVATRAFSTLILKLYILQELCPFEMDNMVIFHTKFKMFMLWQLVNVLLAIQ
jgi:hypothetical protein